MARKRVVSRTIKTTVVTASVTDILEAKVLQMDVTVTGGKMADKQLEKAVKKEVEKNEELKFNCIVDMHEMDSVYSMPEEQFILLATKIEK